MGIATAFGEWRARHSGAAVAPQSTAATPPTEQQRSRASRPTLPAVLLAAPARSSEALRPPIAARAAIVADVGTGAVLWARHPHRRLPIASTTKIMTATIALEQLRPETLVRVPPSATRVPLVREGLRSHERVEAWKLLDGLLIFSGNDDAMTLAVASAGTKRAFVKLMNEKARELGLQDSHFSSVSGVIDEGNYSSAWDLAALTRVALQNPRFRKVVRTRIAHVPWSAPTFEKVYVNKNPLLGTYRGADGVKTGWTTLAGHCLVASATRSGRTIVAVLLHDANAPTDARRLLNLGFRLLE
ncbi:MAG TPA: D-alanyl-D-alanine carboxypeptidase family protein [Gaiellaceae bacterium]|nr:D-alanyl-D-alanine carboxypeptidase family protein [Gaiellaceae bacterium]